jgi:hypothetical protein
MSGPHLSPEDQVCEKCQNEKSWRDCWNCGGDGFSDHDCGDDSCCCLFPEDNVECDICSGEGGFRVCDLCYPEDECA